MTEQLVRGDQTRLHKLTAKYANKRRLWRATLRVSPLNGNAMILVPVYVLGEVSCQLPLGLPFLPFKKSGASFLLVRSGLRVGFTAPFVLWRLD